MGRPKVFVIFEGVILQVDDVGQGINARRATRSVGQPDELRGVRGKVDRAGYEDNRGQRDVQCEAARISRARKTLSHPYIQNDRKCNPAGHYAVPLARHEQRNRERRGAFKEFASMDRIVVRHTFGAVNPRPPLLLLRNFALARDRRCSSVSSHLGARNALLLLYRIWSGEAGIVSGHEGPRGVPLGRGHLDGVIAAS